MGDESPFACTTCKDESAESVYTLLILSFHGVAAGLFVRLAFLLAIALLGNDDAGAIAHPRLTILIDFLHVVSLTF